MYNNIMKKRIIFDILLLLSIFLMPFYFTLIFSIFLLFYFRHFYEFLIVFFLIDLLYGIEMNKFANIQIVSLLLAVVIYFLSEILKTKLRFY